MNDEKKSEASAEMKTERPTLVVPPLGFVTGVIASCVGAGLVIYWLLRSMHI